MRQALHLFFLLWLPLLGGCVGSNVTSLDDKVTIHLEVDGQAITSLESNYIFGVVNVGESKRTDFLITNLGSKSLTLFGFEVVGDDKENFAVSAPPSLSLASGESTTFFVTFAPLSGGAKVSGISIYSNDRDALPFGFGVSGLTSLLDFVDGAATEGVNKLTTQAANSPILSELNSKLYSMWSENNAGGISQIRATVFDGNSSFSFVDGNGLDGLNYDTLQNAITPKSATFNDDLYLTWVESNGSENQIRVSVYNGNDAAPAWTRVDGAGANGLNKDTTRDATNPLLLVQNSKLYLFWLEESGALQPQVRAAVFNGNIGAPSWTFVDGNGALGLNTNTSQPATDLCGVSHEGKIYLFWSEENGTAKQLRASVYNNDDGSPVWTLIDGMGTDGLNYSSSEDSSECSAYSYNSKLYLSFIEQNAGVSQVRALVNLGDDETPVWTFIDGNGASGLNQSPSQNALAPVWVSSSSLLQLFWQESNGSQTQIRGKLYNGVDLFPTWVSLDGQGSGGLNFDASQNAASPYATPFNGLTHLCWVEMGSAQNQIRQAKSQSFSRF